jgi:hypothetical protein
VVEGSAGPERERRLGELFSEVIAAQKTQADSQCLLIIKDFYSTQLTKARDNSKLKD